MDSSADPQAFDDKDSEAARESAADAAASAPGEASASRAVTPFEAKTVGEPQKSDAAKPEPPQSAPVPSSALVIVPPQKGKKFDGSFIAGERPGGAPRARRTSLLSYLLRAAAVVVVAGGAYAAGSRYLSWPALPTPGLSKVAFSTTSSTPPALAPAPVAAPAAGPAAPAVAPAAPKVAPDIGLADLRRENRTLSEEVHKLQLRLAALQAQTPDDIHTLKKTIESLQASLDSQQTDFKAQIAQLSARLDRLHEGTRVNTAAKPTANRIDAKSIQATLDRVARVEAENDGPTGSIPAGAPHAERAHSLTLASAEGARHAPQLLQDWVVRDVYRGIALVEGPQGAREVMPGDVLPGAGTVRAIQRRGDGWIVLTSRGFVDYDHD